VHESLLHLLLLHLKHQHIGIMPVDAEASRALLASSVTIDEASL